jgi:F-type H+-transporting ATPase subunit a
LNFDIKNYGVLKIGGLELWITQTMVNTWIIMGALIALAIVTRVKLKKFKEIPKGFQNVIEFLVETFDNNMRGSARDELMFLGSWFFTLFAFVLISNISGVWNMRAPTADWSFTVAMAMVTFFLIQIMALRYRKGEYLKSFLDPIFVFLPVNIIGEIARPISLSFRLFGNMLGGLVMMTLIYEVTPIFAHFVIPAALHVYFDLFSGVLQTYIFCTLSLSFINNSSLLPES